MPEVIRTPDEKFTDLALYPFEPNWFDWNGLRMHYQESHGEQVVDILLKRIAEE